MDYRELGGEPAGARLEQPAGTDLWPQQKEDADPGDRLAGPAAWRPVGKRNRTTTSSRANDFLS